MIIFMRRACGANAHSVVKAHAQKEDCTMPAEQAARQRQLNAM
jgi:hypothetical protein